MGQVCKALRARVKYLGNLRTVFVTLARTGYQFLLGLGRDRLAYCVLVEMDCT